MSRPVPAGILAVALLVVGGAAPAAGDGPGVVVEEGRLLRVEVTPGAASPAEFRKLHASWLRELDNALESELHRVAGLEGKALEVLVFDGTLPVLDGGAKDLKRPRTGTCTLRWALDGEPRVHVAATFRGVPPAETRKRLAGALNSVRQRQVPALH